MIYSEFLSELKSGPHGAYLFYGPEAYLKVNARKSLRENVTPGDTALFNRFVFESETPDADAMWNAVNAVPVMSDKKLIEIIGLQIDNLKEDELSELCSLLKASDTDDCVTMLYTEPDEFDVGTEKKPSQAFKMLSSVSKPVNFQKETPARLVKWIKKHFDSDHITVGAELPALLIERCGPDMFSLTGEISKLTAFALRNGKNEITADDLETVCPRNADFDSFALTDAILNSDADKAFSVLSIMKSNKERPEMILSSISGVACDLLIVRLLSDSGLSKSEISAKLKIHEYRVGLLLKTASRSTPEILRNFTNRCYEADKKIKSTFSDSYDTIDLLIAESIGQKGR